MPLSVFSGLKRKTKFSEEKFCYKICCEIEPLLLMGLATPHKSIEWLRWENMQPVTLPAAADLFFLDKSRTECWQFLLASHKDYRWGRLLDTGSLSGDAGCCQQQRNDWHTCKQQAFSSAPLGPCKAPWEPFPGHIGASTSFWKPFWGRKVEISFDKNINLNHLPGPK